jgi:hypothetical protein
MKKLYAVKLKKTSSEVIKGRYVDMGHHTTLPLNQAINLIKEKGISRVEAIRHDDKIPRNTRLLNRTEMLELWQAYERTQKAN